MSTDHEYVPFRRPETTLQEEFWRHMSSVVTRAALGHFVDNVWGLSITTDLETECVNAYLWFESEPTHLDRFEMAEFAFEFDDYSGGVEFNLHWLKVTRQEYGKLDHRMQWIYVKRHPERVLPDDFVESELRY
ncbi:MAG: hypothetical protein RIB98_14545 [Acidimicrobiales bacterium]